MIEAIQANSASKLRGSSEPVYFGGTYPSNTKRFFLLVLKR